jgi:Uri superfamily endonuclease
MAKIILKGTYCLIIHLEDDNKIQVGKLGSINFKKGYYVYVGSALNSLESRLRRHLSINKKIFWHVDYLLDNEDSKLVDIVFAVDNRKWECELAAEISNSGNEILGFGCSDCKCSSHLFHFDDLEESVNAAVESLTNNSLNPKRLEDMDNIFLSND